MGLIVVDNVDLIPDHNRGLLLVVCAFLVGILGDQLLRLLLLVLVVLIMMADLIVVKIVLIHGHLVGVRDLAAVIHYQASPGILLLVGCLLV